MKLFFSIANGGISLQRQKINANIAVDIGFGNAR